MCEQLLQLSAGPTVATLHRSDALFCVFGAWIFFINFVNQKNRMYHVRNAKSFDVLV